MASIYPETTITCLPSYREGLPKCFWAASCARPVIAFNVAGSREIVEMEKWISGSFKDQNRLKDIDNLITDKRLCKKMGRAGRNGEAEFSDRHINRQTFDIWDEVL